MAPEKGKCFLLTFLRRMSYYKEPSGQPARLTAAHVIPQEVHLFKLVRFLKPYRKECIAGPLFKLFEAVLELLLPTIMALIINHGVAHHDVPYIFRMGGLMLCMAVLGFGSSMICQYFAARASQGFGTTLRNTVFEHIFSLSYAELDSFGTPSLINRITNDINQLQLAVAMLIRLVIRAPFICIGAVVMAMILEFKLSLVLVAAIPFFAAILFFFISKTSPLYGKYQKKLDRLSLAVRENMQGVRVIRAFACIPKETRRFKKENDELTAVAVRVGKISALLNPLTSVVVNGSIVILLWMGAFEINAGTLSPGTVIAFINYSTQMLLALIVVSNLIVIFTKASASAARINEILAAEASVAERADGTEASAAPFAGKIPVVEFRDVSFRYTETGDMELEHVSVSIPKGYTVGIIGGTGSGKSTFVHLIARFYDVSEGVVFVDGIDVRDYSLKELRSRVSIVPQKTELFSGTVAENLRWGNGEASDEDIRRAARIAQADEFIGGLENGYDTPVSRGGVNFSGGQRQRLTVARALVKKSEILIMDDSSSALDFATDAAMRRAIRKNSEGTTVFIVSQRASTVKDADMIIVFDDGKIAAAGTHEQLVETSPIYREICLSQLSEQEAGLRQ